MSLTNPKKIVTEERLSEFYNGILPYLGGMPDLLANKFNRSDLYDTSEKLVGRWIDGKPLYQKTLVPTTGDLDANTWTAIGTMGIGNNVVDKVVKIFGMILNSDSTLYFCIPEANIRVQYNKSDDSVSVYPQADWAKRPYFITIQYTKTTDSTTSIGVDTDYSTTEKIVGTWIDGKPVWQKTFKSTNAITSGDNVIGSVSNPDVLVFTQVTCRNSGGTYYSDGNMTSELLGVYVKTDGTVTINSQGALGAPILYVTIQYTKTS